MLCVHKALLEGHESYGLQCFSLECILEVKRGKDVFQYKCWHKKSYIIFIIRSLAYIFHPTNHKI